MLLPLFSAVERANLGRPLFWFCLRRC